MFFSIEISVFIHYQFILVIPLIQTSRDTPCIFIIEYIYVLRLNHEDDNLFYINYS